jgi:uncharacterized protein
MLIVSALSACAVFAQPATEKSLLWEISGNGLTTPSYLFGTVHAFDSAEFRLPREIFKMIAASTIVACEMDITDPAVMRSADVGSVMRSGKENCVATDLDNTYRKKLETILERGRSNMMLAMVRPMIKTINPYYLSVMILAAHQAGLRKLNYQTEVILLQYTHAHGKPVISLETMQEQMDAASGAHLSHDEKMQALRESIDHYLTDSLSQGKMFEAYKQQDLEYVLGETRDRSFTQRNETMVRRLIPNLYKGSVFTMVGAAHLPFQNGMIRLLRDRGFTVKPVRIALVMNQ